MKVGIVFGLYLENPDHLLFFEKTVDSIKSSHELKYYINETFIADEVRSEYEKVCASLPSVQKKTLPENNVSRAWNEGLVSAISDGCNYVLIANADIVLKANALDNLVSYAEDHPDCEIVTASEWTDIRTIQEAEEDDGWAESPHFSCFLCRNTILTRTGGFDENFKPAYHEDNDLHYRMKLLGLKAVIIGKARFFHYGSRTIKASRDPVQAEFKIGSGNTRDYYLHKWGGLPGQEKYEHPYNDFNLSPKEWRQNERS